MSEPAVLFGLLGLGIGVGLVILSRAWRRSAASDDTAIDRWSAWKVRLRDPRVWRWCIASGAAGLAVGVLTGWVVGALLAAMAVWSVPRMVALGREQQHQIDRIEAVAEWTEMPRDVLGAGVGLEQAITATARVAPAAIRPQMTELVARVEHGERLAPSLKRLADRLADPTADLVVTAMSTATQFQVNDLAALLGRLAHKARSRVELRRRTEAARARVRTTVRVVLGTFSVYAGVLVLFNPDFLENFATVKGQLVLLSIGLLYVLAYAWIRRESRIDEPPRILTDGDAEARVPAVGIGEPRW